VSRGDRRRGPTWLHGKRPVFQFVGLFILFMAIFYFVTFIPGVNKGFLPAYMRLNAQMSAAILTILGENATANGTAVSGKRYAVAIEHGCDAIEPSALFVAAVLAFPAPWLAKLPGLLAGTVIISMINLVRIVSLYYTGHFFPRHFETVHVDVWQPIFVLVALLLWVLWAWWSMRPRVGPAHVPA
jgi:exosortase H (IPTLxxWG-CTERM-specific)